MELNILITSVGRRSYIVNYFKQALKGLGEVHACNSIYTIGMQAADDFFIAPAIYSDSYIDEIIAYSKKHSISAVLSLFDIDLLVLAKHASRFEQEGIELILAPEKFIAICNDKLQTAHFAQRLGIRTPLTFSSINEVLTALSKEELHYPIIMKPRWGMASMSIFRAYNETELLAFTDAAKREIENSYLKYETAFTPKEPLIYQELLSGKEFGIDIIHDLKGQYQAAYVKQKVSMRSGETDVGLTVNNAPFLDTIHTISSHSGHRGILSVDVFLVDGNVYLLEMNCRISGHYPISHLAGVNYPQMLVSWLQGKEAPAKCFSYQEGLYATKDLMPTLLACH